MDWPLVLLLAPSLGMDAFAVALAVGAATPPGSRRPLFRLSFHFGLFQFLMPMLGWLTGATMRQFIEAYDHWVAFLLLAWVGARMVRSAWDKSEATLTSDPTRGISLVVLSIATSIDALAVGLSLAMLQVNLWLPSLVIGVVAAGMTLTGMLLGRRLKDVWGRGAEFVGGVILIGIGLRVLWTHLVV